MLRPKRKTLVALTCGLGLVATGGVGCRGRDLRVPPVPRYSDEPATAPGPGAALGSPSDPYSGLNPYADANLGALPTVGEAPEPIGAAADAYGQSPVTSPDSPPPSSDPASYAPPPMPDPSLPPPG